MQGEIQGLGGNVDGAISRLAATQFLIPHHEGHVMLLCDCVLLQYRVIFLMFESREGKWHQSPAKCRANVLRQRFRSHILLFVFIYIDEHDFF